LGVLGQRHRERKYYNASVLKLPELSLLLIREPQDIAPHIGSKWDNNGIGAEKVVKCDVGKTL
jgi:hypothetical protein